MCKYTACINPILVIPCFVFLLLFLGLVEQWNKTIMNNMFNKYEIQESTKHEPVNNRLYTTTHYYPQIQ